MFGCGKFDEITMLKYLEGSTSGEDKVRIEEHLSECKICLSEVLVQNRIQAGMESAKAHPFQRPRIAKVFVGEGGILSGWNASGMFRLEAMAGVRGESGNKPDMASIQFDQMPVKLAVMPTEAAGVFWVSVEGKAIQGKVVELFSKGEELPKYSKTADDIVVIKGLKAGNYLIRLGDEEFQLSIELRK